jgi:hypothetical protein
MRNAERGAGALRVAAVDDDLASAAVDDPQLILVATL